MAASDTIFALSTPYGKSGVALFRISSPTDDGLAVAIEAMLARALPPRRATLCALRDENGVTIDQVIATYFPNPHSFTGESVVEIACHGSIAVIEAVSTRFAAIGGWRHARAGEFARRAFANGKLDLLTAEGLAEVLNARTGKQLEYARGQAWGKMSASVRQWRDDIVGLQALAEASIDFSDDLDEDLDERIQAKAASFARVLDGAQRHGEAAAKLLNGYRVALVGAPNAGKSSLLNALSNSDTAIVSDIAGTTRDQVSVELSLSGLPVRLIDSAGLRDAHDEIESIGVARARALVDTADLVIEVLGLDAEVDHSITADLRVRTHADVAHVTDGVKEPGILAVSSVTGAGLAKLQAEIVAQLSMGLPEPSDVAFVQQRQRQSVAAAIQELLAASVAPSLDLVGEHLRLAAHALAEICGDVDVEDVLDVVFGSFCIGK